jgi:hypothetical protein
MQNQFLNIFQVPNEASELRDWDLLRLVFLFIVWRDKKKI